MLDCYGFTSDDVSYFAAAMMICGILSATLVGLYIEKTLNYSLTFKILSIFAITWCTALPVILSTVHHNVGLMMFMFTMMGIIFLPFIPLSLSYGTDILFPFGEAQITGCILTSGQLVSIVMVLLTLMTDFCQ